MVVGLTVNLVNETHLFVRQCFIHVLHTQWGSLCSYMCNMRREGRREREMTTAKGLGHLRGLSSLNIYIYIYNLRAKIIF